MCLLYEQSLTASYKPSFLDSRIGSRLPVGNHPSCFGPVKLVFRVFYRYRSRYTLRVQSTQEWSIHGFCIRTRDNGLGYIPHIGALGPLGIGRDIDPNQCCSSRLLLH